ncbi:MAG TPA: alkaline phosphatase, partial [Bacteroidales bacterium]|nr:alkaline phosphatase [Bacteroidales bacterium]
MFYFIGDGMGLAQVALAEAYLAGSDGEIGSRTLNFTAFPVLGTVTTYSASNMVTCSSAAGTALATGTKTKNGMLGMAPDSVNLKAITYKIKEAGFKVGVSSTVTLDHATPGAFYANAASRSDYYNIAVQLPDTGFDFFGGGGGSEHFAAGEGE